MLECNVHFLCWIKPLWKVIIFVHCLWWDSPVVEVENSYHISDFHRPLLQCTTLGRIRSSAFWCFIPSMFSNVMFSRSTFSRWIDLQSYCCYVLLFILQSYNPTILQSCLPSVLLSYNPLSYCSKVPQFFCFTVLLSYCLLSYCPTALLSYSLLSWSPTLLLLYIDILYHNTMHTMHEIVL